MALKGHRSVALDSIRALTSEGSTTVGETQALAQGRTKASMQVVTSASSVAIQFQVSLTGGGSSEWRTLDTWASSSGNISGDIITIAPASSVPVFTHARAVIVSTSTNANTSNVWISVV
ncbi:hypothetical protein LCGC14_1699450 [marine sediment metagenome]|uniref:Uncharacterized protein n=1 Tax=marine sediment metagenome TaxID=412755 RepID=A0A0F9HI61_9ZZZZ